jgi:nicotinic acid phosphoribosyltransferase
MTFEVLGEITFHWRRLGAAGRPVVLQRRTHLEVTAPIIEAQLVETFIINQINLPSLIATKWFMSLRSPPEDENGSEER